MKQLVFIFVLITFLIAPIFAQSINENSPTPVLTNEISSTIPARDIGDARLTRHFYTFFANNGDVDLKIEMVNFDGDVDLFEASTLRPLAKITFYDNGATQTLQRTVYFRKREQVVLRVEGRTLSENAARYSINLTGSFEAANLPELPAAVEPEVTAKTGGEVVTRVNSAGAIIEVLPEKTPVSETNSEKPEKVTAIAKEKAANEKGSLIKAARNSRINRKHRTTSEPALKTSRTEAVNQSENTNANANAGTSESNNKNAVSEAAAPSKTRAKPRKPAANRIAANRRQAQNANLDKSAEAEPPNALANVQLVIQLKSGTVFTRPISEVFNLRVDKGQITVITKAGKIERFSLLDVQKMSIE